MNRIALLAAGATLSVVPAVVGLSINQVFSHIVSVHVPAGAEHAPAAHRNGPARRSSPAAELPAATAQPRWRQVAAPKPGPLSRGNVSTAGASATQPATPASGQKQDAEGGPVGVTDHGVEDGGDSKSSLGVRDPGEDESSPGGSDAEGPAVD
ncbi:MAG: hypothetical protein WCB04_14310 [Mycobacteriales bacterium]